MKLSKSEFGKGNKNKPINFEKIIRRELHNQGKKEIDSR